MATVIKPPEQLPPRVFLAGTIDNGASADWQAEVADSFADKPWTLMSPRRDDWDPLWSNGSPQLRKQIVWELDHLDQADAILMHFEPGSVSPITLLELGLYARSGKLVVSCSQEFWRYANVEVTCARHDVPLFDTLGGAVDHLTHLFDGEVL